MSSVSLDVSGIDWEKWMDVFLEIELHATPGTMYVRLDGDATSGHYQDKDGRSADKLLSVFSWNKNTYSEGQAFRLGLQVSKFPGLDYYTALMHQKDISAFINWYNASTPDVYYPTSPAEANHVSGAWCRMQSIDFVRGSENTNPLSWSNIRLIGMKRP